MVETSIIAAAFKTIGKNIPQKQAWMTNEILDICDERRKLKSTVKVYLCRRNEYNTLNAMLRIKMNKTKEEWIQEQCNSINEDMSRNRSNKMAYKIFKMLNKQNYKNILKIHLKMILSLIKMINH